MKPLLYLASPYTALKPDGTPDNAVMQIRASLAAVAAARIVEHEEFFVYSPIVHNHSVNQHFRLSKPSWDFWGQHDIHMLRICDAFCVLTLDGWRESRGVREEARFAELTGMPKLWAHLSRDGNTVALLCSPPNES